MQHHSPVHPVFEFVAFAPAHLEGAFRLSQQAGWPHRVEDWKMALANSDGIAAVKDGVHVVGTVLVTPYGTDAATINMVIVDAAQRGRGLGRKLMEAAIARAGGRPLRLIATRDGLPLYESLGFVATGTILQHQGVVGRHEAPAGVDRGRAADIPAIVELDAQAFGAGRGGLIAAIASVGRFAVLRRDDRPVGFAALRAFGRGEVIGPVVAPTLEDAKTLILDFVADRPGAFLRVDTTAASGLGPWLAEIGLAHVGGGIAMQRPVMAPSRDPSAFTFALANQAFG